MHPTADVSERFKPFLEELLHGNRENIDSVYITGSALTPDYDPKHSDINSVVVLNRMDLTFLEHLAPLGKRYGKKKLAAPLIMTPEYIDTSLDVFPIEFFNIQLLHHTVHGKDRFAALDIRNADLRRQCEREVKVRLIGLRQGYLSAAGDRKTLTEHFINTITGYIPLFRGIIRLLGKEPPGVNADVLRVLAEASGADTDAFDRVLTAKKERATLSIERLNTIFEAYYRELEKLRGIIDDIDA